ncbi:MAG: hypothetical protein ACJ73N_02700 [Bryobacteraceae bacterium]|jgi:hypothetical protein
MPDYVTRDEVLRMLAAQERIFTEQMATLRAQVLHLKNQPRKTWSERLPSPLRQPAVAAALVSLLIAGFCLLCIWPGLTPGFDGDDLMNLNFGWQPPLRTLVIANLVPFTSFYRPAGGAYYRLCLALFGWHPAFFRTVTVGLLLLNLLLVYKLAHRLSGSREVGALAALLYTFHGHLQHIYDSNGTVYDVLCGTLSLSMALYYIRLRQENRRWGAKEWLCLLALFIAAVNAKEMAAALPPLLLIYEWLWHGPPDKRPATLLRWLVRQGSPALVLLALAAAAAWGKGSALHAHPLYAPTFTLHRFFDNARRLHSDLLYIAGRQINTTQLVSLWASLFVVAALTRRKTLWFCAWWCLLAPLPIIFIPYRGFFVMYVPYVGWAIYLAVVLVALRNGLMRFSKRGWQVPTDVWEPERIFLFCVVAWFVAQGGHAKDVNLTGHDPLTRPIQQQRDDFLKLQEPLPRGARVLLLHDRFPPGETWWPLFTIRVVYRDPELWVDRLTMLKNQPDEAALASYDRVLDFDGQKLSVIRRRKEKPGRTVALPTDKGILWGSPTRQWFGLLLASLTLVMLFRHKLPFLGPRFTLR